MLLENNSQFVHNSINILPNKHINLLHVGWEKCIPNYTYINQRNIYLLHFIYSGKGHLQINNTKYKLSTNEVFLIRPNHLATYTADSEDPWEYYYFAFSGDWADELLSKTCFANDCVCTKLKNNELCQLIKNSISELNDSPKLEFLSIEYLFKFFSCLYSKSTEKSQEIFQQKNHYVSTLEEYIMSNYQKPLTVSALSKTFGLNRSHLHRLFKSQTGKSLEEFIIHVRIQEAKRFLRETDFNVNKISHLVGYRNYPSFFRIFKNLEGTTPTEYRNQHSEILKTN